MKRQQMLILYCILGAALVAGCGDAGMSEAEKQRKDSYNQQIQEAWGKPYDQLEVLQLVAISPHNEDIKEEFEKAFSIQYALNEGKRVEIDWRSIGGGGSKIREYLVSVYDRSEEDTAGIDIVWGGGEDNFEKMAEEGILQKLEISEDVKANIPAQFGGLLMYDPDGYWCGAAVSGFGFLYNKERLESLGVPAPKLWDDLGAPDMMNLVALADPTQSSSAAAANEMIVQSGEDWPDGWAKLLAILSNATQFYSGASGAADAVISEAAVATCIDFYGTNRVAKYPDALVYVAPKGQTAINADPIAILKNPPHADLAQAFVDFVLSPKGQALWALPVGAEDGPVENFLGRKPIRKDVYLTIYKDQLAGGIEYPFDASSEMAMNTDIKAIRFDLLKYLVKASAVNNPDGIRAAKKTLIETDFAPDRLEEFNRLPENIATLEALKETAEAIQDETQREKIMTDWEHFFREKYQRVAE